MLSLITCAAKQAGEPSTHDLLRMSNVSPQEIAKWKAPNASLQLAVHGSPRLLSAVSALNAKLIEAMMPDRQGSDARRPADTLALPSG